MSATQVAREFIKWQKQKPPICTIYHQTSEQRKHQRIPVKMALKVRVQGKSSAVFCETSIVNFSRGGICIRWDSCAKCGGYLTGKIHPGCIFGTYDYNAKRSHELVFYVKIPDSDAVVRFRGKAVYVYRSRGKEQIGIKFIQISEETLNMIESIIRDREPIHLHD